MNLSRHAEDLLSQWRRKVLDEGDRVDLKGEQFVVAEELKVNEVLKFDQSINIDYAIIVNILYLPL